jgi:hypothetical protein
VRVTSEGALAFAAPTLFALVLGAGLIVVLMGGGVLQPAALLGPARSPLANANGVMVLAALLLAGAQAFTALMPDTGVLAVLLGVFYVAMLGVVGASGADGPRTLRGLLVLFGAGLVLRFVVLNGLAAPTGSLARRVFAAALDGLAPGGLGLEHHAPATGYAVFAALVLLVAALALLPGRGAGWARLGAPPR